MNKLIIVLSLLFCSMAGFSQSETGNYITKDTVLVWSYDTWHTFPIYCEISYPAGLFTTDTGSRPMIVMMGGVGQMNSNPSSLKTFGPHYFIDSLKTFNGGIKLSNGIHFPIYLSVSFAVSPPQPPLGGVAYLLWYFQKYYHVRAGSTYVTGLSEGAFTWSGVMGLDLVTDTVMKKIKAIALFSGAATNTPTASAPWSYFGKWSRRYGGRAFLTVGYADAQTPNPPLLAQNMNDSMPGSAYYATNTLGGGSHCCWNSFFDPSFAGFSVVAPIGPYITTNGNPNTQGTYIPGENIYQWMLRQGDTTLVGQTVVPPPANKPPVALITNPIDTLTQPVDSIRLTCTNSYDPDGKIVSYAWKQTAGPIGAVLTKNADSSITVSHLANGSYTFQLTVTDNSGASTSTYAYVVERFVPCPPVVVCPPPVVCPVCPPQRTAVGFSLTLTNGQLVTIVTYSDGSQGPVTPQ